MLKNLLKYDLKNVYKVLIVFYGLDIFLAILTRIFLNIDNSFIMNIIGQICSGATIGIMISIVINNLMRAWVRFKNNFYGDESFLTHTIPVEKNTLYLSKVLMAVITLLTSIIVIVFTIFIAYYSKDNMDILKESLRSVATLYNSSLFTLIVIFLLVVFLEFLNILQTGYMGIIFGHKMNNKKVGYSIIFGFIAYLLIQIFTILVMFIISLFNKDLLNLFITNEIVNMNMLKIILILAIIIYSITFIVSYIINIKAFKKGVNVD